MNTFEEHLEAQGRSALTVGGYTADLQDFRQWYGLANGLPFTGLFTPTDVREYKSWLQTVRRAAPATINRRLAALRSYGAFLIESGRAEYNPAAAARAVKQQLVAPRWLDKTDQARVARELERSGLAARTDPARRAAAREAAIGIVLLNAGLRVAELCELVMEDVTLAERSGWLRVRSGKGDKYRELPLNLSARGALSGWIARRPAGPGHVFISKQHTALRPRAVQRMLAIIGRRAGVKLTPHTLRHTFAHNLIGAGVSLDQIAALMGHSRLETTSRYTLPGRADLARAVSTLDL